MAKVLVAYFSASGQTARAAAALARAAGADLFEIRPARPYTDADLDWTNKSSRSSVEMADPASRPEIAAMPDNMADYEAVLVGFPIWWYTAPHIILNFLESADLAGRTVAAFATSGGSPMGRTDSDLKKVCPAARWLKGRLLRPSLTEGEAAAWLAELGLLPAAG
ncbi:MAG: flavodoxin [Desulfovibrionaceae bacterium]|nr:flavodoxin [Desulfovibrionaceae bacterium]